MPNPTYTWPYVIYAVAAIALTAALAWTLHRNGKVFLGAIFPDDRSMARAVNSMLVTGFFMLNLGYGFLISRTPASPTAFEATEQLIQKLGLLLVSLGVLHFVNMAVLWKIRRNMAEPVGLPVAANTQVPPPPTGPARTFAPA